MAQDETLRTWGFNIKARRQSLNLTQSGLAEVIEVKQSTVARWEAGSYEPRRHHKAALARALSTDVMLLFPMVRSAA